MTGLKLTFALFMKSQAYCMGKEFAFKDNENNNREMKLHAHNRDQTLACFCVGSFPAAHTATAPASRPPATQVSSSCAERNPGCGGERKEEERRCWHYSSECQACFGTCLEFSPLSAHM